MAKSEACPCDSGSDYAACCFRFHSGAATAPDALALMRSRYSAYVRCDEAYIQASWHPDTRPPQEKIELCQWIGLQIVSHQQQLSTATVEFIARYKLNGRAHRLHETSRFVCENERWLYLDGVISN